MVCYANFLSYKMYSMLVGYDEKKYWRLRQRVVDVNDKSSKLRKLLWLAYLRRVEAKNSASFGTTINAGTGFHGIPKLLH